MRLLKVVGDNMFEEVRTTQRLATIIDAMIIARTESGDGQYVVDYGNGSYHEIEVQGGQPHQFDPNNDLKTVNMDHTPARAYDRQQAAKERSSETSSMGTFFPEGSVEPARPQEPVAPAAPEATPPNLNHQFR